MVEEEAVGGVERILPIVEKKSFCFHQINEVSHVVQVRAEGPKAPEAARPERAEAPSPGHRPGYNGNQQGAL